MKIQHQAINLELTEAIREYINKKVEPLFKFLEKVADSTEVWVEVKHDSKHHKKGNIFSCEIHLKYPGKNLRAESEADDLYKAIDLCKDALKRQLSDFKNYLTEKRKKA